MYCGAICSEEKIEDNAHGLVHLILLQSLNWLKEEEKNEKMKQRGSQI